MTSHELGYLHAYGCWWGGGGWWLVGGGGGEAGGGDAVDEYSSVWPVMMMVTDRWGTVGCLSRQSRSGLADGRRGSTHDAIFKRCRMHRTHRSRP